MQRCLPSRRQQAGRDDSELLYIGNKAGRPEIRISRNARADRTESCGVSLRKTNLQNIGSAVRAGDPEPGMVPRYPSVDLGGLFIIGACPSQFVSNGDWIRSCPLASKREARCRLAHAQTDSRSRNPVQLQRQDPNRRLFLINLTNRCDSGLPDSIQAKIDEPSGKSEIAG